MAKAEKLNLKILVNENSVPIYNENAAGSQLSTFNQAVRGSYFSVDKNYELHPSIIQKWSWDTKEKAYIITLNKNNKFHDGSTPNSSDLEFSLLRGFFSEKKTFYEIYLGNIEGVRDIKPGEIYKNGLVSGIKIINENTVKIKLSDENPSFLFSLTRPFFSLAAQRFYNKDFQTWKKWPIGTGNYKVIAEDNEKITLEKANDHAKFNIIEMYKVYNKSISYDVSYYGKRIDKEKEFLTEDPVAIRTIFFNQESELSKNSSFREALYYLLERSKMSNLYSGAKPSYEYLPTNFWSNHEITDVQNKNRSLDYAKKIPESLLKKTWKVPVFSATTSLSANMEKLTKELKAQIMQIGIKLEFYASDEKFLSQKTAKDSAFSLSSRICDNLDPLLMFGSFRTDSAYKYDNAQNDKEFDKLYDEAAKASGNEDRVKTLRKLSKYALDKRFFIPLLEEKNIYYYNSETVKSMGNQTVPTIIDFDLIEMK